MRNNSNTILVTIGIPFFNTEKYLGHAIESVIKQSYSNWELLLMDDGSSDNSVKIAKSYAADDDRIKVFSSGENLGLPKRLNELSSLAKGEYYARMDADDIMHPERIKTQINYLIEHPEVDLLGTGLIAIDGNDRIIGIRKGETKDKYALKDILNGGWSVHPTITGKTSWFKNNKYDENLTRTEDFDLWVRTVNNSTFSKIDFLGLFYREESDLSLKKYIISTKQSFRLYWKNRAIIGIHYVFIFYCTKILKLAIYLLFYYCGLMSFIVKRRSKNLESDLLLYYENILKEVTQSKH